MSEWDTNLYYNPADNGVTQVAQLDQAGSYEFNIVLFVKRDADGAVFCLTDSGCSCPTPFEGMTLDKDGERVFDRAGVRQAVERWWYGEDRWGGGCKRSEVDALISKVVDNL